MAKMVKVHETITDSDTWLNWEMVTSVQSAEGDMVLVRMVNGDTYRVPHACAATQCNHP